MTITVKAPISISEYVKVHLPDYTFGYYNDQVSVYRRCSDKCLEFTEYNPEDGLFWCRKHNRECGDEV